MSAVFFLAVEQEAKVTPPGRRVAPSETVSGYTGNFQCHTVSHHLSDTPPPPPPPPLP